MNNESEQRLTVNEQLVKTLALQVGFDACGVSQADYLQDQDDYLSHWLKNGFHGEMGYLERNIDKRFDPRVLVPNSKSVISVILNYNPGSLDISTKPPKISRYALGLDYHIILKAKLHLLLELLRKEFGNVEGRTFVDSAPVLERTWAVRAGLGWIGKNSLLINPKLGSYFFIGELIVDLEIESSHDQIPNRCGSCSRCMEVCPTGAIISPMVIDSRKCISYLTIEKKSPLTDEEKKNLNGWCFGCDICQEVCPWNSKSPISTFKGLKPKKEILHLSKDDLITISKTNFEQIFGDTPINRTGFEKFVSLM